MAVGDRAREQMGLGAKGEPGKELSPLDKRIADLRAAESIYERAAVGGVSASVLVRDAETALRNLPDLAKCERTTFFGALMTAAQLGLRPNVGSLGHGWILPYWSGRRNRYEANWILGYQGMIELGYRSGLVRKITAHTIYANEPHKIQWGTEDVLTHEPIIDQRERGEAVWHYACVWLQTGGVLWNAITDDEARSIMNAHGAKNKQGQIIGPWRDDYEPMARKTALRGLWRFMPKTEILSLALSTDTEVRTLDAADATRVTLARDVEPDAGPAESGAEGRTDEPVTVDVEPEPEPGSDDVSPGSGRQVLDATPARRGLLKAIESKHGPDWGAAAEIVTGDQSVYSLDVATTEELKAILAIDTATIAAFVQQS